MHGGLGKHIVICFCRAQMVLERGSWGILEELGRAGSNRTIWMSSVCAPRPSLPRGFRVCNTVLHYGYIERTKCDRNVLVSDAWLGFFVAAIVWCMLAIAHLNLRLHYGIWRQNVAAYLQVSTLPIWIAMWIALSDACSPGNRPAHDDCISDIRIILIDWPPYPAPSSHHGHPAFYTSLSTHVSLSPPLSASYIFQRSKPWTDGIFRALSSCAFCFLWTFRARYLHFLAFLTYYSDIVPFLVVAAPGDVCWSMHLCTRPPSLPPGSHFASFVLKKSLNPHHPIMWHMFVNGLQ